MRVARPFTIVLGLAGAAACLVLPSLDGKVCEADGGGCGPGETCATSVGGHGLGLAGSATGLCSPLDAGCAGLTCPEDAGLYICGGGSCFASGNAALGGLPCWSELGRCRAEGLYLWELDGGVCLTDGTNLAPQPECRLDGGYVIRCACDGIDNDCDGLVNDVPPRPAFTLSPAPLPGGCADPDGGVDLAAADAGESIGMGGLAGCALFNLGASYAVASVTFESAVVATACGQASGPSVLAKLFASSTEDGGYTLVGGLPGAAGTVSVGSRVMRLALCVPVGATFSGLRVRSASILPAQECDTSPSGS